MSQNVSNFITKLVVHFPVRHENEAREKEWLQAMAVALRGYDGATLTRAASLLIETRKDRRFPLPAECKDACAEALKRSRAESPQPLQLEKRFPEWSDARLHLADDLCMTPMGRRAAQEDWILAYWNFCRDNARAPQTDGEIRKCIANARGFDDAFENCRAGRCGPLSRHLTTLGTSMLQRREDLKAMVLDGVVR